MMPAAVGALIMALLAILNVRLGRSTLYPPAQFAILWFVLLALLVLFDGVYFPLSVESVAVFCVGAIAFTIGGGARLLVEERLPRPLKRPALIPARVIGLLLTIALVILICFFPVFWSHVLSLADRRFTNLWLAIRAGALTSAEVQGQRSWAQFFFDNMTVASIILALIAMVHLGERAKFRLLAYGLVLVATVYNLATGAKVGAAAVLVSALGITIMKRGHPSYRHLLLGVLCIAITYVPLTLLRARSGDPLSIAASDLRVVGDTTLLYTAGPLAAFDAYLSNPTTVPETWSISYFFSHAASRMGFDVSAPSIHVGYVMIGPNNDTNTYTMYFAYYPQLGWFGVVGLTALVGYVMVWLYQAARSRQDYLLILYGIGFFEICMSGFHEGFFMGLNLWIKVAAVCLAMNAVQHVLRTRTAGQDCRDARKELVLV